MTQNAPDPARGATRAAGGEPFLRWIEARTHNQRMSDLQFDDPRLEYRRLFSEVWGTFLLVLVAAGGGVMGAQPTGRRSRWP